jgi:hypothetical protein
MIGKHLPASTNTQSITKQQPLTYHAKIEELLEAAFSMHFVPRLYNEAQQDNGSLYH